MIRYFLISLILLPTGLIGQANMNVTLPTGKVEVSSADTAVWIPVTISTLDGSPLKSFAMEWYYPEEVCGLIGVYSDTHVDRFDRQLNREFYEALETTKGRNWELDVLGNPEYGWMRVEGTILHQPDTDGILTLWILLRPVQRDPEMLADRGYAITRPWATPRPWAMELSQYEVNDDYAVEVNPDDFTITLYTHPGGSP